METENGRYDVRCSRVRWKRVRAFVHAFKTRSQLCFEHERVVRVGSSQDVPRIL